MKTAVILTFSKENNRGANIQCFALMKTLRSMGYEVFFLDIQRKKRKRSLKGYVYNLFSYLKVSKFRNNNGFAYTRSYISYEDLVKNPPEMDVLVIGSDQVWNNELTLHMNIDPRIFYGGFCKGIKKISYAASFGTDKWVSTEFDDEIAKAVCDLSAISVREESGMKICKNVFGRDDVCNIADPSLLLSREDLDGLIGCKSRTKKEFGYVYLLHRNPDTERLVDYMTDKFNKPVKGFSAKGSLMNLFDILTIPEWLANIRDAEYIITNSFHCMVMCILFQKDFYVIPAISGRETRMLSLLAKLQIADRYVTRHSDLDMISEIDYDIVGRNLHTIRNEALKYLEIALKC